MQKMWLIFIFWGCRITPLHLKSLMHPSFQVLCVAPASQITCQYIFFIISHSFSFLFIPVDEKSQIGIEGRRYVKLPPPRMVRCCRGRQIGQVFMKLLETWFRIIQWRLFLSETVSISKSKLSFQFSTSICPILLCPSIFPWTIS